MFVWEQHERSSKGECRICSHLTKYAKGGRPKKPQFFSTPTSREVIVWQLHSVAPPSILLDDRSRLAITSPPRSLLSISDLSCILCRRVLDRPIFLTTCASLVCLQGCCSALDNSSEEVMCPCCNGDHIHDIQTVVPPTAVVTKAIAGLEVRYSECSCKVRMG